MPTPHTSPKTCRPTPLVRTASKSLPFHVAHGVLLLALLWKCPRRRLVPVPLESTSGLVLWQWFLPPTHGAMPCRALCLGLQHLGLCSGCFLSPVFKLDARSSLSQAWYGTKDWQPPLAHVHRLLQIQLRLRQCSRNLVLHAVTYTAYSCIWP